MNNKGYVLPMVMMISSLLFFILSHQVGLYVTDMKFYHEKFEMYKIDRLLQKGVKDIENALKDKELSSAQFVYDEGRATIQISTISQTQKNIRLSVLTNNSRTSTVILYYNPITKNIYRWLETK